jgi:hypothetical protein
MDASKTLDKEFQLPPRSEKTSMTTIAHNIRRLRTDYCPILNRNEKKCSQLVKAPSRLIPKCFATSLSLGDNLGGQRLVVRRQRRDSCNGLSFGMSADLAQLNHLLAGLNHRSPDLIGARKQDGVVIFACRAPSADGNFDIGKPGPQPFAEISLDVVPSLIRKFISVRLIESLLFSLDHLFLSLVGFPLAFQPLFRGLLFLP